MKYRYAVEDGSPAPDVVVFSSVFNPELANWVAEMAARDWASTCATEAVTPEWPITLTLWRDDTGQRLGRFTVVENNEPTYDATRVDE